jgi:GAF domain-containing protein
MAYEPVIALPLLSQGHSLGGLTIYAGAPGVFDIPEVKLLEELATDLAYGLTAQRTRLERKQAEKHIRDLNLLLRGLRDIGALIVREREPQKLLTDACEILVRARGYALAWIGLAEPGSKRVVPIASAGQGVDYLDELPITWDEAPTSLGPVGSAMKAGRPWVCHDTSTDPQFAAWRERALVRGFASLAAVPMIRGVRWPRA